MSNITIRDLKKVRSMTELGDNQLKAISGGVAPLVPVAIAAGSAFVAGVGIGVSLYNTTQND